MRRVRGFGALSPYWDIVIKPSMKSQESTWKWRQTKCKSQRWRRPPRRLSFRPNRTDAHMKSQKLWQHSMYKTCTSQTRQDPSTAEGKWHKALLTTKKAACDPHLLERDNECPWVCQPHSKVEPLIRTSWSTPNRVHGFSGFFFLLFFWEEEGRWSWVDGVYGGSGGGEIIWANTLYEINS